MALGSKYDTTNFYALRALKILKTFAIRSFFCRKMATCSYFAAQKALQLDASIHCRLFDPSIMALGSKYDTTNFYALRALEILKTFAIRSFFCRKMATCSCFAAQKALQLDASIHCRLFDPSIIL